MSGGERRPVRKALSRSSWRKARAHQKAVEPWCRACGRTTNLVAAHKVPAELSPFHHDDPRNLMTLCVACNAQQANLTLEAWNTIRATRGLKVVPDTLAVRYLDPPAMQHRPTLFNRTSVITRDYTRRPHGRQGL